MSETIVIRETPRQPGGESSLTGIAIDGTNVARDDAVGTVEAHGRESG